MKLTALWICRVTLTLFLNALWAIRRPTVMPHFSGVSPGGCVSGAWRIGTPDGVGFHGFITTPGRLFGELP